jgi:hypothetical protein
VNSKAMHMEFVSLAEQEVSYRRLLSPSRNLSKQYPRRYDPKSGFALPSRTCQYGLIWLWLRWHATHDMTSIRKMLTKVITREIALNLDTDMPQRLREDHDHFLIQLAVLNGDVSLMKNVAESVSEGIQSHHDYQCFQAFAGVLKHRILGDEAEVRRQYSIFQKHNIVRYYVYPTKRMMDSLVTKDYASLARIVRERAEHWWTYSDRLGAVSTESGKTLLHIDRFQLSFFWPWVHATFVRLAYMDGADIVYDSVWIPLDLIRAV